MVSCGCIPATPEFLVSLPGLREERPSESKPPLTPDEKARERERRRARAEARLRRGEGEGQAPWG